MTLLFFLPLCVCIGLWHWFWGSRRGALLRVPCSLNGRELLEMLLPGRFAEARRPSPWPERDGRLRVRAEWLDARDAATLGMLAQEAGTRLVMDERRDLEKRRRTALRFGAVAPTFVLIIALLGTLVGRIPLGYAILAVMATAGFAAILNLTSLAVEIQGATRARRLIHANPPTRRSAELDAISHATEAAAWRKVVPAAAAWLVREKAES